MNKIFKILGGLLLIYIVFFSCNKIISSKMQNDINNSPVMETLDAKLEIEQVASIMNNSLPKTIDKQTTVTKVEYLDKENKLVYNYQITGLKKRDKSEVEIESIIQNLKESQIDVIKSNPDNATLIKAKVTFEYIYKDVNGDLFCSYMIKPVEYLK
ncbi:hypothetical protein [Flavobacterium acetivorans]|uniref:hypothetical protein n=1 Tax=Flavobacterium acetivorans TaxID=2893883 RepID=UPI001E51F035|nr:hypothetical protein [Flavobacterium sp. F-29]UFH36053.1 hypothetical protein LNP19_03190 [Flavobacterium sp. F-29]